MWISRYFVLFIIFSIMGWIYETIYCTVRSGVWKNRGFLFGPLCPIYGAGAVTLVGFMNAARLMGVAEFTWWQIFIVSYIGSAILEYLTSYVLELLFHAKWWDYSYLPLNIKGRICVPASCLFGAMGILVSRTIYPWTIWFTETVPPIIVEFISLILMAILAADITLTVEILTNFEHEVKSMEESFNQNMEFFVKNIQERTQFASEFVSEGKEQIGALASRIAAERQELSVEHFKKQAKRIKPVHRMALGRISSFNYPKHTHPRLEVVLKELHLKRDKE